MYGSDDRRLAGMKLGIFYILTQTYHKAVNIIRCTRLQVLYRRPTIHGVGSLPGFKETSSVSGAVVLAIPSYDRELRHEFVVTTCTVVGPQ